MLTPEQKACHQQFSEENLDMLRVRVAICLVFPGHVLFFRVKNSVRADFLNLAKCPGFLINDHLLLFPINSMLS